jgi:hypothetical protein
MLKGICRRRRQFLPDDAAQGGQSCVFFPVKDVRLQMAQTDVYFLQKKQFSQNGIPGRKPRPPCFSVYLHKFFEGRFFAGITFLSPFDILRFATKGAARF